MTTPRPRCGACGSYTDGGRCRNCARKEAKAQNWNCAHGWSAYCNQGCRCDTCVTEAAAYRAERRRIAKRPDATAQHGDWYDRAACKNSQPGIFFPPDAEGKGAPGKPKWKPDAAKAICEGCDVRQACLEFAVTEQIVWGVWGGMTENERPVSISEIRQAS